MANDQPEETAGSRTSRNDPVDMASYTRRLLVTLLVVAAALLVWQAVNVFLLAFAGTLLAVLFSGLANRLNRHTPLSRGWALAVVVVGLFGLFFLLAQWLGPSLSDQFSKLAQRLPETLDQVRKQLQQSTWGSAVLGQVTTEQGQLQLGGTSLVSRLTGVVSATITVVVDILIVLAVGIFFAATPGLYREGIARLVPRSHIDRTREYLDTAGYALWRWLTGKLIAMAFVGLFITGGLMLLGMPLALILGLIAGLLDFVPFIGPIAAAVPAVLLAFTQQPMTALWVALLYFVAQQIEGDVISPLIQRHEVSLSPAVEILAAVTLALVFGILGAVVAVPLFVVVMVGVKMLYMHDVLGYEVNVPRPPGRKEAQADRR